MSADQENASVEEPESSVENGEFVEKASLLSQAISATKQTEPSQAESLLKNFVDEAMKGTVTWDRNLTVTFREAIAAIDNKMSHQLAEIMHAAEFQKLEGSWRGLHYLVMNSETSTTLKLKVMNVSKVQLAKDLDKAVEFDQSEIYKKLYEHEFGTPGGEPYGALIGDYQFTKQPEDIQLLRNMSSVAAASFAPFISAASSELFGFDDWTELSKPRDLAKIFDTDEYIQWRSFRESEDSRFVQMVMPQVLSRLPYGKNTNPVEEFEYEEAPIDQNGIAREASHDEYCWMNAAYVMGTKLTDAFSKHGWCTAIRGAEGGGRVDNLPSHIFTSDDGDADQKCPTEIGITDRREYELSNLGFMPLSHYKKTDYAVFFGAQSTQKPKKYDKPEATANAAISARLPYIMTTSRIAHYLKVMGRDKVGGSMEVNDVQQWLNSWLQNYVLVNKDAGQEMKAKYPLAEAKVTVEEVPGKPGAYNAVAWLRPWLQMEELTASLRMVARIPEKAG